MDYKTHISDFIKENFTPSDSNLANVKMSTNQLLNFLFTVFPRDCISDYDLVGIMNRQGYELKTYVIETYSESENKKEKIINISRSIGLGWCLKSDFNLEDEMLIEPKSIGN